MTKVIVCGIVVAVFGFDAVIAEEINNPAPKNTVEEVTVMGTRLTNKRIIEAKRDNIQISDSLAADDIAGLPDFNLAEALARVPGVSTVLDNGEDRFVVLRGLNADYNFSTIDGLVLPSTDEATRAMLFDIVPSSVVKQVDVLKSFSADLDGQAIGGRIDLKTRSAFDREGLHLTTNGAWGRWQQDDLGPEKNDINYRFNGVFSTTFGQRDQFGIVASASIDQRDNYTIAPTHSGARGYRFLDNPATPETEAFPVPEFFTNFLFRNLRQRTGGVLKFEYRSENNDLYAYSQLIHFERDDVERRDQHRLRLRSTGSIAPASADKGLVSGGVEPAVEVFDTVFKDATTGYQFGLDYKVNQDHRLEAKFGHAGAKFDRDAFRSLFFGSRTSRLSLGYERQSPRNLFRAKLDNPAEFSNPNLVNQHFETLFENNLNEETLNEGRIDYSFNLDEGDRGFGAKAGLKIRQTERVRDVNARRFRPGSRSRTAFPLSTPGILLAGPTFNSPLTGLPVFFIDIEAAKRFAANNPNIVAFNKAASNELSAQDDYSIEEDILATYAMGVLNGERYRVSAGLRFEHTDIATSGNRRNLIRGEDSFVPVNIGTNYSHMLPRVDLTYDFTDQLRLRAAYSKSVGRPDYIDLRPNVSIRTDTNFNTVISGGNPLLKPRVANNFDLSLEYYFEEIDGLFSVGVFHKDIKDEIFIRSNTRVGVQVSDGAGGTTIANVTRRQPENAENAKVSGIEAGLIISSFDFLPNFLSNFGIAANIAYLDSEASFGFFQSGASAPDGATCKKTVGGFNCTRKLPGLFQQPDTMANIALTYNQGDFDARLAYNYRGKRLRNIQDNDDAAFDRFFRSQGRLDAQVRYWLTDQVQLFAEAKNINGSFTQEVVGNTSELNHTYRDVGPSYWLGVSFQY